MKVLVVTAMYPTTANPAFGSFVRTQVEALKKLGIVVDVLFLDGKPRKLIYPKGIVELRRRLSHFSPDLVHAHYSYAGIVARTQYRVPVIVTYHGTDLLGIINKNGRHTRLGRLVVAAGQMLSEYVDAVIVQNEAMAAKLKRKDVYVIPCEIDCEVFSPASRFDARIALNLHPHKKYLLFAANPANPVKNYPLAAAIATYLQREDPDVELLVVYRESQPKLALFMSACDVLLFTSYQEGSPNIVRQAMACNLPIVATDVGDVRQAVANTTDCYICRPDVYAFVERLLPILSCRIRTNGREHVQNLAGAGAARKLVDAYEALLNRRG